MWVCWVVIDGHINVCEHGCKYNIITDGWNYALLAIMIDGCMLGWNDIK